MDTRKFYLTRAMRRGCSSYENEICRSSSELAQATWLRFDCRGFAVTVSMPQGISGYKSVTLFPYSVGNWRYWHDVRGVYNAQEQLIDVLVRPDINNGLCPDGTDIDQYIGELKEAQTMALTIKATFIDDLSSFLKQTLAEVGTKGLYLPITEENHDGTTYKVAISSGLDGPFLYNSGEYKNLQAAMKIAMTYQRGPATGYNYAIITRSDFGMATPILTVQSMPQVGGRVCWTDLDVSDNDYQRVLPYLTKENEQ